KFAAEASDFGPLDGSIDKGLYQYQLLTAPANTTTIASVRGRACVADSSFGVFFFLVFIARFPKEDSLVCHIG
ncbi:MAG: hypothetical protein ACKO9Q_30450, partial [Pirellula sp.]